MFFFNLNNLNRKIITLLTLSLIIFYFIIPILIYHNIINNDLFKLRVSYLEFYYLIKSYYIHQIYEASTLIVLILIILYFSWINQTIKIQNKFSKNNVTAFYIIIVICLFFLLKDILILLNEHINNSLSISRHKLYSLIDKRVTHLNLLIIFSVVNFKNNKKLSYLVFGSIVIYDLLSFSRHSSFFLLVLHFFVNIELKKNLFLKISLFIIFLVAIIIYRSYFFQQPFNLIYGDSFDLKISSVIFFNNFLNISLKDFIYENFLFLLKDFFYFNVSYKNFFISEISPKYSIRGIDSIICYFIVFLIYSLSFLFLIKKYLINLNFLRCINIYLLICLFRGNFVHNLNFIIKSYLLVIFLSWSLKKLKLLKFKVV
jgi:hypothetical protein